MLKNTNTIVPSTIYVNFTISNVIVRFEQQTKTCYVLGFQKEGTMQIQTKLFLSFQEKQ